MRPDEYWLKHCRGGDLVTIAFEVANEVFECRIGKARLCHQHGRLEYGDPDADEVFDRVVSQVRIKRWTNSHRDVREHYGVAVGSRLRRTERSDISTGSAKIFNDDRLG